MGLGNATLNQWTHGILKQLGAPDTANNRGNLGAWYACEQSSANYNIFNTTLAGYGGVPINSSGVMSYPTFADGLDATIATLEGGNFGPIVAVLLANGTRVQLANAIGATGWGTNPQCIDSAASPPGSSSGTEASGGPLLVSDWSPLVKHAAHHHGRAAAILAAAGHAAAALHPGRVAPVVKVPPAHTVLWHKPQPLPDLPEES